MSFLDQVDPNFETDLDRGFQHERSLARRLRKKLGPKSAVKVGKQVKRPNAKLHKQFTDDGDLRVKGYRVEARERDLDFTSKDDFPYDTVIVDTIECMKKGDKKPVVFFTESMKHPEKGYSIIVSSTRQHWFKKKEWIGRRGRYRLLWYVAKEHLSSIEDGVEYLRSLPMSSDPKFASIDDNKWWTEEDAEAEVEKPPTTEEGPDPEKKKDA